jgi:hypothetical protein
MMDSEQALNVLKQLDARQEQVLMELDGLNDRIEKLLSAYQAARKDQLPEPKGNPLESPAISARKISAA